jgi:hypothetical protein
MKAADQKTLGGTVAHDLVGEAGNTLTLRLEVVRELGINQLRQASRLISLYQNVSKCAWPAVMHQHGNT